MTNLATIFKDEIARISRKQVRSELEALKKSSAQYRSVLAALKRQVTQLEAQVKRLKKSATAPAMAKEEPAGNKVRFTAKGLASQRCKLGLSADDMGALIGASGQSVYKWENEKARPRERQLQAIAAIRGIGKREADNRLIALGRKPKAE